MSNNGDNGESIKVTLPNITGSPKNDDILFKSVSKDVHDETVEFFANSAEAFLQAYSDALPDGTEDAYRVKGLAASRLAQLGLSMFQFFKSAADSLKSGKADEIAYGSTAMIVGTSVQNAVNNLIKKAKENQQ